MATVKTLTVSFMLLTVFIATTSLFLANRVRPIRLILTGEDRSARRRLEKR